MRNVVQIDSIAIKNNYIRLLRCSKRNVTYSDKDYLCGSIN